MLTRSIIEFIASETKRRSQILALLSMNSEHMRIHTRMTHRTTSQSFTGRCRDNSFAFCTEDKCACDGQVDAESRRDDCCVCNRRGGSGCGVNTLARASNRRFAIMRFAEVNERHRLLSSLSWQPNKLIKRISSTGLFYSFESAMESVIRLWSHKVEMIFFPSLILDNDKHFSNRRDT